MRIPLSWLILAVTAASCDAGIIINAAGLAGGSRWDAAPHTIAGNERSLDGGLRYSVSGGSYQAFRDSFSWSTLPALPAFQQAIESAFAAWTSTDPVSGLSTSLSFISDFATPVVAGAFGSLNFNGAEIDLVASNAGDAGLRGFTTFIADATPVTLTSGVANYADSSAIAGVDLHLNNNAAAIYDLDSFRRILTHEIGHAIGLGDVDLGGTFIDDNYASPDPAGSLNNSWAALVNPLDPAASVGLNLYSIPTAVFSSPGVDLLMESNGLGVGPGNPLGNLVPLTNDEYGTRQFLYPTLAAVPEPSSAAMVTLLLAASGLARFRRRLC